MSSQSRRTQSERRVGASRSSSSSSSSMVPTVCQCGDRLLLLTSRSARNYNRKFWRCANWATNHSCNFFKWAGMDTHREAENAEFSMEWMEQELEEAKNKIVRLKLKLAAKRKKETMLFVGLILSWVVILLMCIFWICYK